MTVNYRLKFSLEVLNSSVTGCVIDRRRSTVSWCSTDEMMRKQEEKRRKRERERRKRFPQSGRMMEICAQWTSSWGVGLFLYFHSSKIAIACTRSGLPIFFNKYQDTLRKYWSYPPYPADLASDQSYTSMLHKWTAVIEPLSTLYWRNYYFYWQVLMIKYLKDVRIFWQKDCSV